jgi:transcriptional regulator with XRE-family HTH domain
MTTRRKPNTMTDHPKTRLGRMLRLYRAHAELTLRDLAPMIGISPATLMRVEAGFDMDAETLLKLITWMRGKAPR